MFRVSFPLSNAAGVPFLLYSERQCIFHRRSHPWRELVDESCFSWKFVARAFL